MKALSVSAAIAPEFARPRVRGVGLGQGYVAFATFVLALTPPGRPRMPNGVETPVTLERGAQAWLGDGVLELDGAVVEPGPPWQPVPVVGHVPTGALPVRPDVDRLAGRGPGMTPAGDDVLAGYAAGLTLFHGNTREAAGIAERASPVTTRLSATLLAHAARGELPEPAHAYLASGDAGPLERFGHSSGRCIRLGLDLAAGSGQPARPAGLEELLELAEVPFRSRR